jgi:hypothetical protein
MTRHLPRTRTLLAALAAAASCTFLPAQGIDPTQEIQEIARRVEEQLTEIDRLLLESGKKDQARSRPKELLQQAKDLGKETEATIDDLIKKLTDMKNQGGGGSSSSQQDQQDPQQQQDQQQQQPQQQQQQRGQQNRRENQTPDFVRQPQQGQEQQQGQQQQPQPQGQQQQQPEPQGQRPQAGHETPDGGQNKTGNNQPEPELGPGNRGAGDESWGELQPYVNFLKNRGSPPKVPEKFRKYWEAYLKQKPGAGGK